LRQLWINCDAENNFLIIYIMLHSERIYFNMAPICLINTSFCLNKSYLVCFNKNYFMLFTCQYINLAITPYLISRYDYFLQLLGFGVFALSLILLCFDSHWFKYDFQESVKQNQILIETLSRYENSQTEICRLQTSLLEKSASVEHMLQELEHAKQINFVRFCISRFNQNKVILLLLKLHTPCRQALFKFIVRFRNFPLSSCN